MWNFDKNPEIQKIYLNRYALLTSEYLLYEFPRGNQVDGLPRVSHVPNVVGISEIHAPRLPSDQQSGICGVQNCGRSLLTGLKYF